MRRRKVLSTIVSGAALGTTVAGFGAAAESTSQSSKADGVVYEDERGRIIRLGPHSYGIENAESKKDFLWLADKRDEILNQRSSQKKALGTRAVAMSSSSGSDSSHGTYSGHTYSVSSDLNLWVDGGEVEIEARSGAIWCGDNQYVDDPISAEITINTEVTVQYQRIKSSETTISVPPAWTITRSFERLSSSYSNSFNNDAPTVNWDRGAIEFYGGEDSCIRWVRKSDDFKFEYSDGTTEYYGTSIRKEPMSCY